jgi:hypothetical protein
MKYKNVLKLRLPEIQLLAVVLTHLKFSIVERSWRTYNFFGWNIILYVGVFQYGNRVTHWGYVGAKAGFNANYIFK